MVQPSTGDIYVLTKHRKGPSGVYKIKPVFGGGDVQTVTGLGYRASSVAARRPPNRRRHPPYGRRVVLCDYVDGYELSLPAGDPNFDDIWKQAPAKIELGPRDQGEAIAYGPDGTRDLRHHRKPKTASDRGPAKMMYCER